VVSRNVHSTHIHRRYGGTSVSGTLGSVWDPQAAFVVGVVLLEAIVLHVGYGGLSRLVGPRLLATIAGGDDAVRR